MSSLAKICIKISAGKTIIVIRCPIFIGIVDKGCIVIDSRDGEGDFCFMNRIDLVVANGMVVDDCFNFGIPPPEVVIKANCFGRFR